MIDESLRRGSPSMHLTRDADRLATKKPSLRRDPRRDVVGVSEVFPQPPALQYVLSIADKIEIATGAKESDGRSANGDV